MEKTSVSKGCSCCSWVNPRDLRPRLKAVRSTLEQPKHLLPDRVRFGSKKGWRNESKKRGEGHQTYKMGPLTTFCGFIPSYTHLQPWSNRVCWGYNYLITRGAPSCTSQAWNASNFHIEGPWSTKNQLMLLNPGIFPLGINQSHGEELNQNFPRKKTNWTWISNSVGLSVRWDFVWVGISTAKLVTNLLLHQPGIYSACNFPWKNYLDSPRMKIH